MLSDEYDELDRDPKVADDLAHLDALLGMSPPPFAPADRLTRARFDEMFTKAVVQADAAIARKRRIHRRLVLRRLLTGGVATAATAAAAAVGWFAIDLSRRQPAYAATPPALPITASPPGTARVTLQELAYTAQQVGGSRVAVDHLVTDRWSLDSVIDGTEVTSAVIPRRSELWRTRDDAARTVDTYLPPQFPSDEDREAWRDAGSPRGGTQRTDYGEGEYPGAFHGRPPQDPDALAAWLARGGTDDTAIFKGVADLLLERALTAPERSAVLHVLATRTPLVFAGTAVDRAGRTGTAFTAVTTGSGAQVTQVFVIAPRTGRILATEKILTAGASGLKVRRPAVISYNTYLVAEQVPAIP